MVERNLFIKSKIQITKPEIKKPPKPLAKHYMSWYGSPKAMLMNRRRNFTSCNRLVSSFKSSSDDELNWIEGQLLWMIINYDWLN